MLSFKMFASITQPRIRVVYWQLIQAPKNTYNLPKSFNARLHNSVYEVYDA